MSLILRSFLRDPRPLSRAIRRMEDDWFLNEWPARKIRRTNMPAYEHPVVSIMDDMSRQMANTLNRMQNFVEEMDSLDELANRFETRKREANEAVVRRTESGGLQLALDVMGFEPKDLKIKLIDDHLVVEAENETSGEDSYRKSHFKRWFKLPEDCKLEEIKSTLTDDDKLVIDLPLNKPIESNARTIPIEVNKKKAVAGSEKKSESHENQTHQQEQDSGEHTQRAARARQ